jgi:drug/metabolite transporter (DMT)-like permease
LIENKNIKLGVIMMILATFIFALQDGLSRYLAGTYNVYMIVMIRYWFLFVFVVLLALYSDGGLAQRGYTKFPIIQVIRGLLLAFEIVISVKAFVLIGLINTSTIFSSYPLIATLLAIPILKEIIGWRRFAAIFCGFLGVLLILQPGLSVFSTYMLLPICSAITFAIYGILTRYVSKEDDPETSFFWTGITGAITMTVIGLLYWQTPSLSDWPWLILLCIFSTLGHFLLIKSYDFAAVSIVQPFAYFHLIFISLVGILIFDERLSLNILVGSLVVICAGIFTLKRQNFKQ